MSKRLATCEMWVYYKPTQRVRRCRAEPVGLYWLGRSTYKLCDEHSKHGKLAGGM